MQFLKNILVIILMAGFSFVQYSTLKANDIYKQASSHQSFAKTIFLHSIGADAETHAINTGIAAPAIRATHLISIPYGRVECGQNHVPFFGTYVPF